MELAVTWPRLLLSLPTTRFPPLAEAAQATLQEGAGESLMPCDGSPNILPLSWSSRKEPLGRGAGDLGPLCMKKILSACYALPFLWKTT